VGPPQPPRWGGGRWHQEFPFSGQLLHPPGSSRNAATTRGPPPPRGGSAGGRGHGEVPPPRKPQGPQAQRKPAAVASLMSNKGCARWAAPHRVTPAFCLIPPKFDQMDELLLFFFSPHLQNLVKKSQKRAKVIKGGQS